jgi:hypothetical protein
MITNELNELILMAYRLHFSKAIEQAKLEAIKKLQLEMDALVEGQASNFASEVIRLIEKQ